MKALLLGMLLVATAVSVAPLASAAPDLLPEFQCMEYYRQTDLGPVVITQRSSCDTEVCVKDDQGGCSGPLRLE